MPLKKVLPLLTMLAEVLVKEAGGEGVVKQAGEGDPPWTLLPAARLELRGVPPPRSHSVPPPQPRAEEMGRMLKSLRAAQTAAATSSSRAWSRRRWASRSAHVLRNEAATMTAACTSNLQYPNEVV